MYSVCWNSFLKWLPVENKCLQKGSIFTYHNIFFFENQDIMMDLCTDAFHTSGSPWRDMLKVTSVSQSMSQWMS